MSEQNVLAATTLLVSLVSGGAAGAVANIWYQSRCRHRETEEAICASWHEIALNRSVARHNAFVGDRSKVPHRLFLRFRTAAVERMLLNGSLVLPAETRAIATNYLHYIDHVHMMIDGAEDNSLAQATVRYCSGRLDTSLDGGTSVPEGIRRLQGQLERAHGKILGAALVYSGEKPPRGDVTSQHHDEGREQ